MGGEQVLKRNDSSCHELLYMLRHRSHNLFRCGEAHLIGNYGKYLINITLTELSSVLISYIALFHV